VKVALTVAEPSLDARIDPRFGRGAFLLFIDTDDDQWEAYPNESIKSPSGAGVKTAQFVMDHKVGAVISGDFGPNALRALQSAHVPLYLFGKCVTGREAVEKFKAGRLRQVHFPDEGN